MEVTLHFWEMVAQHVQPVILQGIELPFSGLVAVMVIGSFDLGGSGHCFSFALTNAFARLLDLLRLRHGLGTICLSKSLGLRIDLSDLVSRSGVYLTLKNVS